MCEKTGLNTMSFYAMGKVLLSKIGRHGVPDGPSNTVMPKNSANGVVEAVRFEAMVGEEDVSNFFVK